VILDHLAVPVVLAPLAGGPSTPQLAAAVSDAGGFGFLAAGYLSPDELARRIDTTRELTTAPFGVNLFVPAAREARDVSGYARELDVEAQRFGVELGRPRVDDDGWDAKVALLLERPVPVVSFTFGVPDRATAQRLHDAGSEVWVTVGTVAEAGAAAAAGADVLVAQGSEAGGHRGGPGDEGAIGLLALLQLLAASSPLPLVASGGIATAAAVRAVLALGARAAAAGTAFLRCPEAGTSAVHRAALARPGTTALTRAFTGRTARGIRNDFLDRHSAGAPAAYPEVHYLTAPLRQAGRDRGDPGVVNLWAGEAFALGRDAPAAEVVHALAP
jgi:nitronate monooxygenase